MKSHGRMLRPPVMLMAGACLEFISGHAVTPPRWLGPLGLEWVHRFASDPRRFAFRYLVEPWRVLFEISKHDLAQVSTRALGFRAHPRPEGAWTSMAWRSGRGMSAPCTSIAGRSERGSSG